LWQAGAAANVFNDKGLSPLLLAAERGYVGTVQALLKGSADPTACEPGKGTPAIVVTDPQIKQLFTAFAIGAQMPRNDQV
jgi:ankyrin repeat protein